MDYLYLCGIQTLIRLPMWSEMSDPAIIRLLGERLKALRIRKEMTQAELAYQAGATSLTVANLEKGKSVTVANLIRIMRALDMLENLEEAFPAQRISPILLKKLQGRQVKRVRKSSKEEDLPYE
ncbi:MAG: helix-turn-helix domain-containing protein [Bacteroidaceae bacterium]|nr:helix-turn-helix domain-containing protein [Bacteroidaceae bacterium]